jgi:hypothetical protein
VPCITRGRASALVEPGGRSALLARAKRAQRRTWCGVDSGSWPPTAPCDPRRDIARLLQACLPPRRITLRMTSHNVEKLLVPLPALPVQIELVSALVGRPAEGQRRSHLLFDNRPA